MCGRPDFGQRRRTLERLSTETNAAWEHACSYALLGRSIKKRPDRGAAAAFQPDQIKAALPTNGQWQFLTTLDPGSGFPCTGLRGVHPAVSRRVATSSLGELPEDPVPVATRAAAWARNRYRLGNL